MNPRTQPLAGLRVVDLTTFLSGPYGTQILGDLGADVIKVEAPAGDASRAIPPYFVDGDSAYYLSVNRNKRSIVADLKTDEGRGLVGELATVADIVIENFRPGVLDRLGLRYRDVAARNPGVVWCSLSGFGQDGPYRDRPAYDMIVQALSGGMSLTGMPEGPAVRSGIPIGDLSAGMYAVIGILAAVHQRTTTGLGQRIDVSMLDCQISMLSYQGAYHLLAGASPGRQGRGHDSIPTYRAFTAADGTDVIVTANTEGMWRGLCDVLELAHLTVDPRFATGADRQHHADELVPLLAKAFATRRAADWLPLLHAAKVPAAPVNSVSEALADPHVRQRGMVVEVGGDDGRRPLRLLGNPVKFADTARARIRRPPVLGEHTEEVLQDWLPAGSRRGGARVDTNAFRVYSDGDGTVELTLTAEKLTIEDVIALAGTIRTLPADTPAVLLGTAGVNFCLGRAADAGPAPRRQEEIRARVLAPILEVYAAVTEAPFPIVAAVRGRATGLGFALAGCCDAIVASEAAEFSLPEIDEGFAPLLALSQLVQVLPRQLAFHLATTGARITAQRLRESGVVAAVVADAALDREARLYAGALAIRPATAAVKAFLTHHGGIACARDAEYAATVLAAEHSGRHPRQPGEGEAAR